MPSPFRYVELPLYADDTAVIATSCQPALLVKYLENYFCDLERRLSEWRIAINVSKSSAMLFAETGRRIPKTRTVQLFGEPIQWVDDARYLGVTLEKRLTRSKHIDQVRKKAAQRLGTLGTLLNRRSGISIMNGVLLYKQLIRPVMDYACPVWWLPLAPISRNCKCCSPSVLALLSMHPGTLVTGKFTTTWESSTSPTISDIWDVRLEVSWCGKPVGWAAWQTFALTKCRTASPNNGKSGSPTTIISATLTEVFRDFPQL